MQYLPTSSTVLKYARKASNCAALPFASPTSASCWLILFCCASTNCLLCATQPNGKSPSAVNRSRRSPTQFLPFGFNVVFLRFLFPNNPNKPIAAPSYKRWIHFMTMFGGSQFRAGKFIALHGQGKHILWVLSTVASKKKGKTMKVFPFASSGYIMLSQSQPYQGLRTFSKVGFYGTISVEIYT